MKKFEPNTSEFISFQGVNSKRTSDQITWEIDISDFLKSIISGKYGTKDICKTIDKIRYYSEGTPEHDKNKYDEGKAQLPAVCVHAHFKPDEGYPNGHRGKDYKSTYTNIVAIDIDGLDNVVEAKSKVADCLGKHAFTIAISPGGHGLHVYLHAKVKSKEDIAKVQKSVAKKLKVVGIEIDPTPKDEARILFLTWDPKAIINEIPTPYKVPASIAGTLLDPTAEFYDIENLMAKKKMLGEVRYTDNVIWPAFLILAKNFDREYVDKYLGERREILFHPSSNTTDKAGLIETNLNNAYKKVEEWRQGFADYFKTNSGIFMEYEDEEGIKQIQTVNTSMFRSKYGEFALKQVRSFCYFASIPNNYPNIKEVEFKSVPDGCYNMYEPLKYQPAQGNWDHIRTMFEHFTRDQTQYLYDYVKLLLTRPSQILPILVLLSTDRETGKTTFLDFLYELFNPNGIIISMQEFTSRFNSHIVAKSIVAIDETKLNKQELEKIKSFSTAKKIASEFKGKDAFQVRNYQHYILTSNSLEFTYYDKQETRFWCFEFPPVETWIKGFYGKVKSEIPHFIHYLLYEHIMAEPKSRSRAWFSNEVVTQYFRETLYEQTKHPDLTLLKDIVMRWFEANPDYNEMRFMGEKVRRFFKLKIPISEFVNLLLNESWINRYDSDMQYHIGLFEGTIEFSDFPAALSKRTDRRRKLFYVKREDLIEKDDLF